MSAFERSSAVARIGKGPSPDPSRPPLTRQSAASPEGLTFAQTRVALLMIAVAATAALMPAQSDSYWHLRAGYDLARTGHVPLVDTYSHTARGLPWPNHEWLWQALSWACHRAGGMPLLTAVGAAMATAACAVAYGLMRARPSVNFVLALIGIPLASVVWALRPQVASLLLLVLLLRLLTDERPGRLLLIPPLFLLWANLHGAVALGGVVLAVATVVASFHDRRLAARLAALTVVCGALTAATPMGVHLWTFIGQSMARSRQNQIMEWMPSYPRGPIEIAFWVAALVLVGATVARWKRLSRFGDRLIVAVALVLIVLAARAVRNIAPFCLVWMPAMSRLVGPTARLPGPRGEGAGEDHPRLNMLLVALMAAGATVAIVVSWRAPLPRLGWRPLSTPAVAAVRECGGPLYNRYNEGGYLIWFVPEVPVFIDSRQDPYPPALLTADIEAEKTGEYRALFARHGIRCAALPPLSPVSKRLAADGWRELFRDDAWVVQAAPLSSP